MTASWTQQALIEAPVEEVWVLIADPSRFPDWSGGVIEVTGVPTKVEVGSTYSQTTHAPFGLTPTTTFEVVELDELREIKLRCHTSGLYSRWVLTEARGHTFAEMELGSEPQGLRARAAAIPYTKGSLRRMADQSLGGLRRALGGDGSNEEGPGEGPRPD